jgi:hypothetical protein
MKKRSLGKIGLEVSALVFDRAEAYGPFANA